MDSGIKGVSARTALCLAAAGFLAVDIILLTWGRKVDVPRLLSGLRLANPYTTRDFFGQQLVFIALFVSVIAPFYGPWPISVLALSVALLLLLAGLRLQLEAERSGVAAEERRLRDRYKEILDAMSPVRRFAWRFELYLTAAVVAVLFAAFRRLGA